MMKLQFFLNSLIIFQLANFLVNGCSVSNNDLSLSCNCNLVCEANQYFNVGGETCVENGKCLIYQDECVSSINDFWSANCFGIDGAPNDYAQVSCPNGDYVYIPPKTVFSSLVRDNCNANPPLPPSATRTPSNTQTPTQTPSNTQTPTQSSTQTPSNTRTPSNTQTPTNSRTQTPTKTTTPTSTQTPTTTSSPSPTPSKSPACNADALCALLTGDINFDPTYSGNAYSNFVSQCLDITSSSDPSCSSCSAYSGYNNGNSVWKNTCCQSANPSSPVCCTQLSGDCQSLSNGLYSSQCWGLTVSCIDSNGNSLTTISMGTRDQYESYFKKSGSHPLILPTSSPSPTSTPTRTPTSSQTPTSSFSRTQSGTQTPTNSATPTRTQTRTPTPSQSPSFSPTPSMLSGLTNNSLILTTSDNLGNVSSYRGSFPRSVIWPNILLWNGMDVDLTYSCENTITNAKCEWILRSSIRILVASGYTGIRVWSVYDEIGWEKILVVDSHFTWKSSTCSFQNNSCPYLNLTTSDDSDQENLAFFEFRMIKVNDTRTSPFYVEWIDETLVPHGMRARLNATLLYYSPYPLPTGQSFSISATFSSDSFTYGIVFISIFVVALLGIFIYSCFRKKVVTDTRQYVLNTDGFRTIFKGGEKQVSKSKTLDRGHFQKQHIPFILIVLAWRISYSLVFTLTFFIATFQSINQPHFDTLSHWTNFSNVRNSQLFNLSRFIEYEYGNESLAIEKLHNISQNTCDRTGAMEDAFTIEKQNITDYHDKQISDREKSTVQSMSVLYALSTTQACSISSANGAKYEMNSIVEFSVDSNGTNIEKPFNVTGLTQTQLTNQLHTHCSNVSWCSGFSFNSGNSSYFLFYTLATPNVDNSTSGFCFGVNTVITPLTSGSIDDLNSQYLDQYTNQVNENYNMINTMLTNLGKNDTVFTIVTDRSSSAPWGVRDFQTAITISNSGPTTYHVDAVYGCPNCPDQFPIPSYNISTNSTSNSSLGNDTYSSNLTIFTSIATSFLNSSGRPVNVTEPDFATLVPFKFQWNFPSVIFDARIAMIVVSLDIILIIYRSIITVAMITRYMKGVDKVIPETILGKELSIRWVLNYYLCVPMFRLLKYIGHRVRNWDHTMWLILGKMTFLLQLVVIFMIILISYWFLDNAITLDSFQQFGVFNAMTAGAATQRTLRNEQLVSKVFAYNQEANAKYKSTIQQKSNELLSRQKTFNKQQYKKVMKFNEEYCTNLDVILKSPFGIQVTDPNSAVCCSYALSKRVYTFNLESSAVTDVSNFVIDSIQVDLAFTPTGGNGNCYSNAIGTNVKNNPLVSFQLSLDASVSHTTQTTLVAPLEVWNPNSNLTANQGTCSTSANPYQLLKNSQSFYFNPSVSNETLASVLNLNFQTVGSFFSLTSISVQGHVSKGTNITCSRVIFKEMDFIPMNHVGNCTSISPIVANMTRIYDRSIWTKDLEDAHVPFISALRNIVLSPFYIMLGAVAILVLVYCFLALLEYLMVKVNLLRENTYARVPCLIVNKKEVDLAALEVTEMPLSARPDAPAPLAIQEVKKPPAVAQSKPTNKQTK
eukprot:c21011_g2_i1.p1 GENE.c21011_g2_i1~~c21011_g2_i1.p1  ORF type:complete len:1563 (-),score=640.26 c21011_g2_i1:13-4701(-)